MSLRDREVACSASELQGLNLESCVWRAVSSHSSQHPQVVRLAQFSLYVHKCGLKPDSFHFFYFLKMKKYLYLWEIDITVLNQMSTLRGNHIFPDALSSDTYILLNIIITLNIIYWFHKIIRDLSYWIMFRWIELCFTKGFYQVHSLCWKHILS